MTKDRWEALMSAMGLGSSIDCYNVRKEYKVVPALIYRKKRKELLKSFLNSPSIYNSGYFKDKYERAARQNITRAIAVL